ncbi:MAG: NAD(P)/FAD-dependent oxidoreductase [Chloroflexota bacterium]|nr:NAD(P)/FAD-dependent oxidoreductase [Chloroflexota bacterium]
MTRPDVVVVGSGPNGLAAAIELAAYGRKVHVVERNSTIGGGCRTADLTLPGFRHDICSTIHPLGIASPFFRALDLRDSGLEWLHPPVPLAHPFDDGTAATLLRSVEDTAASLGPDEEAYARLMNPIVKDFDRLLPVLLGPLRPTRHMIALARFGLPALRSVEGIVGSRFKGDKAPALFAGMAAHSMLTLNRPATASFGLVLAMVGHAIGWPVAKGGSQTIVDALARHLESLGGTIETGREIEALAELPASSQILFDLTPRQVERIAGTALPARYRKTLRNYRYGPGIFKIDWALSGPVPWTAPACREAGTVHVGGTFPEIAQAEHDANHGRHPEKPYILTAQPSVADPTRAPEGNHAFWAYCHVPRGSTEDMTERIERQIERFAPGFRDLILARATMTAAETEAYNPNYIGGDINGGMQDIRQLFTRPTPNFWDPYSTPNPRLFICSSATPPGGGVHGMAGYHAAKSAIRRAKKEST